MAYNTTAGDGRLRLHRLTDGRWLEAVLAAVLVVLAFVLDSVSRQPWQVFVLDLAACIAAALTSRWPRTAGIALGLVLACYIPLPATWGTMGEYAPLIPILGTGMRGANQTRVVMTACYGVLLGVLTWGDAPDPVSAIAGWVAWTVLIGVLWLIGSLFQTAVEAQERARAAELVMQRQALAAELHDTVARSLTIVIMTAERAALRGGGSPADLESITATAEDAMRELRLVMSLLAAPDPGPPISLQRTPLTDALNYGVARLEELGFNVSKAVHGDLSTIPAQDAITLGTAAQEAIANIVKHAEPASSCAIVVELTGEVVELAFVNRRTSAHDLPESGRRLGLWGMSERLHHAGGEAIVRHTASQWITTVRLPLSTSQPPGEII